MKIHPYLMFSLTAFAIAAAARVFTDPHGMALQLDPAAAIGCAMTGCRHP